jgi:alkanesulfonate monooxygenase SsuD/methylene tetrahydromethanopterin reductase-like flavin-dependent oxidoreductase (luciferase family)
MDFGIFIEFQVRRGRTQTEAFEESFALVEAAEELGIDTVWLAGFPVWCWR